MRSLRTMDMHVLRIGSVTEAGNVTVVMRSSEGVTISGLGQSTGGPTYRIIIGAGSLAEGIEAGSKPEGLTIEDFPMDKFEVEERPYTFPEDHPNEELRGATRTFRWLVEKD